MAGIIRVYETGTWEGCIDIASERLRWMLQYLTQCQQTSAILQADATFDPWKDMGASNYCTLVDYSDATVAEIARLLIEGSDPSHTFWSDDEKFIEFFYSPDKRQDSKTQIAAIKGWIQKAFQEVATLIQQRLRRTRTPK